MRKGKYSLKHNDDKWVLHYNGYVVSNIRKLFDLRGNKGISDVYDDQKNLKPMFHMLDQTDYPSVYA